MSYLSKVGKIILELVLVYNQVYFRFNFTINETTHENHEILPMKNAQKKRNLFVKFTNENIDHNEENLDRKAYAHIQWSKLTGNYG